MVEDGGHRAKVDHWRLKETKYFPEPKMTEERKRFPIVRTPTYNVSSRSISPLDIGTSALVLEAVASGHSNSRYFRFRDDG